MLRAVVKSALSKHQAAVAAAGGACCRATAAATASTSPRVCVAFMSSSAAPDNSPSVKDLLINLTFVDPSGARRKVTGLVGK